MNMFHYKFHHIIMLVSLLFYLFIVVIFSHNLYIVALSAPLGVIILALLIIASEIAEIEIAEIEIDLVRSEWAKWGEKKNISDKTLKIELELLETQVYYLRKMEKIHDSLLADKKETFQERIREIRKLDYIEQFPEYEKILREVKE